MTLPGSIATFRARLYPKRAPSDDHAAQLEQHPPDQAIVKLHLTDDVFLRSDTWARWQLGILLPVE